jgi:hypothetical protein
MQPYLTGSAFTITDLFGKTLMTGNVLDDNSVIDISGLATGMYLLRVGADMRQTVKVIKQ